MKFKNHAIEIFLMIRNYNIIKSNSWGSFEKSFGNFNVKTHNSFSSNDQDLYLSNISAPLSPLGRVDSATFSKSIQNARY